MFKKLIALFNKEQEVMGKSDRHMRKIFKNRLEENLKKEREVIIFVVDKLWEQHFAGKLDEEYMEKLLYWFELLTGKKAFRDAIKNNISFRTSNLK